MASSQPTIESQAAPLWTPSRPVIELPIQPPDPARPTDDTARASVHEFMIALVRSTPKLAQTLFGLATGLRGPRQTHLSLSDRQFPDWHAVPFRADVVYTLLDSDQRVRHAIIYEVQQHRDTGKGYAWPFYIAAARARWRCPVSLIVLTLERALVRWCARPVRPDTNGSALLPHVLGPSDIPKVTAAAKAQRCPELAVLSVAAHGRGPDAIPIARAALIASAALDKPRATLYHDFIAANLSQSAFHQLREYMQVRGYVYQSEFARHYYQKGREKGQEEGHREGYKEFTDALVELISERFGPLPESARATVYSADAKTLLRWSGGLGGADSLDALLSS